MATTYTITNSFTAGTTAVASQVNQNFTDILTAINGLDAANLTSNSVPLARISGLTTTQFAANVVDTDDTLAADSDTRLPSQSAVKDYVTNTIAAELDNVFGAWASKTNDTSYLAASDGFVCALGGLGEDVTGYTDSSDPPTTVRIWGWANAGAKDSVTMPVRKSDYWKITGASTVYWLPIGAA